MDILQRLTTSRVTHRKVEKSMSTVSNNIEKMAEDEVDVEALDIMAERLFTTGWKLRDWFSPPESDGAAYDDEDDVITGVVIKSKHGPVRSCPSGHAGFQAFENAIAGLNVRVAIKMANKSIDSAMDRHM